MEATVKVLCYKSKTLANGEHPLMVCVRKDRKRKYQSLGISGQRTGAVGSPTGTTQLTVKFR